MTATEFLRPSAGGLVAFLVIAIYILSTWNHFITGIGSGPLQFDVFLAVFLLFSFPALMPGVYATPLVGVMLFVYWYVASCAYTAAYHRINAKLLKISGRA